VPPVIHCVRHAQGVHNLSTANHGLLDPPLTPFGEQECRDLAAIFPHHERIELIVASPLRRTIQTAILAFAQELKRGIKVLALQEIQETSDLPCDTGSELSQIADEFKNTPVDVSLVEDGWHQKVNGNPN
jgi:broad specificity phosphatase PhoE